MVWYMGWSGMGWRCSAFINKYSYMAARFGGKAAVADPTKVPAGIDSSTFFAPLIFDEVRAAVPLFHSMPPESIRDCLTMVKKHLSSGPIEDEEFISLQNKLKQPGDDFGIMFTGIYSTIRTAIYSKTPTAKINTDLKSINVPEAVADGIANAINNSRQNLETKALIARPGFPHMQKLRWRIDVTISSGSLSRVMRPIILMQLILSDGSIRTFEVSIEQFNQLRYSVAKVLHDIRTLDRHPIMKIIREFERKDDSERNK